MELSAQARVLVFLWCGRVFSVRRKTVAAPCISFSLIIVKSLQLCEHRQIAQPRKYCLVRVTVFFDVCFLYFFFISHRLGIRVNSLQLVSESRVRFKWEQW